MACENQDFLIPSLKKEIKLPKIQIHEAEYEAQCPILITAV